MFCSLFLGKFSVYVPFVIPLKGASQCIITECGLTVSVWQIDSTKIDKLSEDTVGPCLWKNCCLLWGQNPTKIKQFYGSSKILLVILGCPFI